MTFQTNSVDKNGLARTPDGKLYVTAIGTAAITGGNVGQVTRAGIPFLRSPSGTMGNNGAFTAGTAFGKTYAKSFMYFAANQITGSNSAGWYYCTGSSTTAFTVFNNTYTSGMPSVPASPTAFVSTGPGATTGDTTEQGILFNVSANPGLTAGWRVRARFTNNNTAGNKTTRIRIGGVAGTQLVGGVGTTGTSNQLESVTFNQGAAATQESFGVLIAGTSVSSVPTATTVDTTSATTFAVTAQIATATDWAVIEWALFEAFTDGT